MRLFVAVDLDDEARAAIGAIQRRVAKALGPDRLIKMIDPAQVHLTLAFLGEIAAPRVPAVVGAFCTNVDRPSFDARFGGLGVFPPRGAPRILWLGVRGGEGDMVELQREVARRAEGLGISLEQRPFHPHVTLARWRSSAPADRERAVSVESSVDRVGATVDHVTLYRSRLSPAGPAYTALARANLT
jgi:2'-5' RNA ligase